MPAFALVVVLLSLSHVSRSVSPLPAVSVNLIIYTALHEHGLEFVPASELFDQVVSAIPDAPITEPEVSTLYAKAITRVMVPVGFHNALVQLKDVWEEEAFSDSAVRLLRNSAPCEWQRGMTDFELLEQAVAWFEFCIADTFAGVPDKCSLLSSVPNTMILGDSLVREYFGMLVREELKSLQKV